MRTPPGSSKKQRQRWLTVVVVLIALAVLGVLLARSLTPRMEGMGPTGSMPMPENSLETMPGMDMSGGMQGMGGMDMPGMNMEGMNMDVSSSEDTATPAPNP
jgi:uncharacterized protein involved in copper resistance